MDQTEHTLVVIPALNESVGVGLVVRGVLAAGYKNVVVVDDLSTDSTAAVASDSGATVISLSERLGAWGATQTGFRYAVRKGFRFVVTIDADGQHCPEDINKLVGNLGPESNVVIACDPSRGSTLRKIAWRLLRSVSGLQLQDITSGFRAYDRLAVRKLASWPATLLKYQDVGILLLLKRYNLKISEVPVTMAPRVDGISRIFSSWIAVALYMAQTCLLGLSKRTQKFKVSRP